jgi:hypothetical protein
MKLRFVGPPQKFGTCSFKRGRLHLNKKCAPGDQGYFETEKILEIVQLLRSPYFEKGIISLVDEDKAKAEPLLRKIKDLEFKQAVSRGRVVSAELEDTNFSDTPITEPKAVERIPTAANEHLQPAKKKSWQEVRAEAKRRQIPGYMKMKRPELELMLKAV